MEVVSAAGQELLDLTASLMTLERRPLEQAQATRSVVASQLSAQRSLASKLSSLRRLSEDFAQVGALSPLRSFAVSGDAGGAFTATAGSTATPGIHSVQVLGLAARHSLASAAVTADGTTLSEAAALDRTFRFTVTAGGVTTEISVAVENGADDEAVLDAVVGAIDRSGAGLTASVARVSDGERKLLLQAEASGTAARITELRDVEGSLLRSLGLGGSSDGSLGGTVQEAADARFVVDGLEMTAGSNRIENAISGVNLQLSALTTGVASIEVTRDPEAILEEVQAFVDSYNEALDEIRTATRPSDETGANRGLLADNTAFRALRTSLRSLANDPVTLASGAVKTLATLGITADREGRLSIKEATLRDALETDPETVEEVMGGENGVAARLAGVLESYSRVGGIVDRQIDATESRQALYDSRIATLTETLALREESIFQQLAELQALIGTLVNQQNYLSSFFSSGSQ